jgi:hypothetical protein
LNYLFNSIYYYGRIRNFDEYWKEVVMNYRDNVVIFVDFLLQVTTNQVIQK